jgi:galactonate dehydratase
MSLEEKYLKIAAIRTIVVDAVRCNYVYVKVHTDEGMYGLGEASLEGLELAVVGAIDNLAPLIVGEDPFRIEHIWQALHRWPFWRLGPVLGSAMKGIDIALWDLKGKALGLPVYELLGGAVRDRVRMYRQAHGQSVQDTVRAGQTATAAGFTAIKIGCWPTETTDRVEERPGVRRTVEQMTALREALGEDVDILLDAHGRMTPSTALTMARALEPFHPYFLEEPIRPESPASYGPLKAASPIPLAAGERLFTPWGFRDVIEHEWLDFVQPDLCHAGGITGVRKIAALAETHYIRVCPHNPLSPVSTAACLHLDAAISNFGCQEHVHPGPSWGADYIDDEVLINPPQFKDGYWELNSAPGLGIDLDETAAAHYPRQARPLPRLVSFDGGVADW